MLGYIILGIVQGIFEWIPISSEGVLTIVSQLMSMGQNPVDLAIFLHAGTTLAVIIYFWRDWLNVITLKDKKLLRFLVIATVVSLMVGYPVYKLVRSYALGSSLLLLMGVALFITGWFQSKKLNLGLSLDHLAVVSGVLQGFAAIPGLSRSGSTIFGLSLDDLSPQDILKYSYMMSVPAIIAADAYLVLSNPTLAVDGIPAFVSSFVVGIIGLHTILKISRKMDFSTFAYMFGFLCLVGGMLGFLGYF